MLDIVLFTLEKYINPLKCLIRTNGYHLPKWNIIQLSKIMFTEKKNVITRETAYVLQKV